MECGLFWPHPTDDDGSFDSLFTVDARQLFGLPPSAPAPASASASAYRLPPLSAEERATREQIDRLRRRADEELSRAMAPAASASSASSASGSASPPPAPPSAAALKAAAQHFAHDTAQQFERDASADAIAVVGMDVSQAQELAARMEQKRLESVSEDVTKMSRRFEEVARREAVARRAVVAEQRLARQQLTARHQSWLQQQSVARTAQNDAFRRMEQALSAAVAEQQAQVRSTFGEWSRDTFKARKYTVSWNGAPRLVHMKLNVMRAVKNKLPAGQ
jgi:hypothetical protein